MAKHSSSLVSGNDKASMIFCTYLPACPSFKSILTIRRLFSITCVSFIVLLLFLVQLVATVNESLVSGVKENIGQTYNNIHKKMSILPDGLKYILLWNAPDYAPFYYFGGGQRSFFQNNCSFSNCYVTSNKTLFGGDTTQFDAIAFNGRRMKATNLPKYRSIHQKYIFFNTESADNQPVCNAIFDGFFNWTSTYRLDSDIPIPYIMVKNSNGEVIGPKTNITWSSDFPEISKEYSAKLMNKSKAAAWFVSNCSTRSKREDLTKKLQESLVQYGYTVDVYGSCGPFKCPREQKHVCDTLLDKDYFFYLSLENSFAEDYVTEKLLTALQHDVVPIVYGGADYARFLPPSSFLDARKYNALDLAVTMDRIIKTPRLYQQFFQWKSMFTYSDPSLVENVCTLCEALNQKKFEEKSVYTTFRKWWNPNYQKRC